jgi:hypothetical protein
LIIFPFDAVRVDIMLHGDPEVRRRYRSAGANAAVEIGEAQKAACYVEPLDFLAGLEYRDHLAILC